MTDITTKFRLAVSAAIKRAYALGQLYWQQADSESYRENAKSDTTRAKFGELLSEAEANAKEAADEIDRLRAEVAGLRAALDRLLCATEGHDVCPYAKAEARYVLTTEGK